MQCWVLQSHIASCAHHNVHGDCLSYNLSPPFFPVHYGRIEIQHCLLEGNYTVAELLGTVHDHRPLIVGKMHDNDAHTSSMSQQWHQGKGLGRSVKRTALCEDWLRTIAHIPQHPTSYTHCPYPRPRYSTSNPPPSVGSPWPSASSAHPPAPSVSSCSSPAPPACSSPLSSCWPNLFGRRGGKDGGQWDSAK